jgi:dephospho-CoA kinase
MIVLGLTGSIGMGKSTVAAQFASLGAKTASADALVHRLLAPGGAAEAEVREAFPEAWEASGISRVKLGAVVFADAKRKAVLEAILHPKVVALELALVERWQALGARLAVLDIPLLFETYAEQRFDATVVVSAPAFVQRARVLARPHMDEPRFQQILSQQMPDREKRQLADFVVHTGLGRAYSFRQVQAIVRQCHEA